MLRKDEIWEGNDLIIRSPFTKKTHQRWLTDALRAGQEFYEKQLLANLQFHSNYTFIMPVLENILSLGEQWYIKKDRNIHIHTCIVSESSNIGPWRVKFNDRWQHGDTLEEALFKTIVKYIEYYYEKKREQNNP